MYCHDGHTDGGGSVCDRGAQRERQIARSDGKDRTMDGFYFHVEAALLDFAMLYRICRILDALLVGVNPYLALRKTNGQISGIDRIEDGCCPCASTVLSWSDSACRTRRTRGALSPCASPNLCVKQSFYSQGDTMYMVGGIALYGCPTAGDPRLERCTNGI